MPVPVGSSIPHNCYALFCDFESQFFSLAPLFNLLNALPVNIGALEGVTLSTGKRVHALMWCRLSSAVMVCIHAVSRYTWSMLFSFCYSCDIWLQSWSTLCADMMLFDWQPARLIVERTLDGRINVQLTRVQRPVDFQTRQTCVLLPTKTRASVPKDSFFSTETVPPNVHLVACLVTNTFW